MFRGNASSIDGSTVGAKRAFERPKVRAADGNATSPWDVKRD